MSNPSIHVEWWGIWMPDCVRFQYGKPDPLPGAWMIDTDGLFVHYPGREIAEVHAEEWVIRTGSRAVARRFGDPPPEAAP